MSNVSHPPLDADRDGNADTAEYAYDADQLDGKDAAAFVEGVDHTKAAHDSMGIDADTVDGQHAADIGTSESEIQASAVIYGEGYAPGFTG